MLDTSQWPILWLGLGLVGTAAVIVTFAGYPAGAPIRLPRPCATLVGQAGMSETVVGVLLTAVATSLPELVTCVAAVRRGAVNLAVGGIIGRQRIRRAVPVVRGCRVSRGLAVSHHDGARFFIGIDIVLACTLLLGLLRRERSGIANIGLESTLVLVIYAASMIVITQL